MKIIRLACEQIPVPRVEEEIIGRGSNRITIAEEQLTSYFKVKVIGKSLIDIELLGIPLILLFTSLSAINPFSSSLRQNSEIHIRLYSLPPSVPRAMLLSISNVCFQL
jgi:hypothetical protein